jgi:ribonuclease T2
MNPAARSPLRLPARRLALAAAAAVTLLLASHAAMARMDQSNRAGNFDYYSLVLSWSPTFCDSEAGRREREQCGANRRFAFVVHGLWPQYERGWPENCRAAKGDYWVDRETIRDMTNIMPSKDLVIHEWKKHGTCSGLGQQDYFGITRDLYRRIKIPARYQQPDSYLTTTPQQLEQDFIAANPGWDASMINVVCSGQRRLREVRFCFTKNLEPRACGDNDARDCGASTLVLPPVR